MKKSIWLFLLLIPLLVACARGSEPAAAPDQQVEGGTAVQDEVLPVSSKPQLIEFYADW